MRMMGSLILMLCIMNNAVTYAGNGLLAQNSFAYIGQPQESAVPLQTLGGYRFYDAQRRHFLKQDGDSAFGGQALFDGYNYAVGNPVLMVDKNGHVSAASHICHQLNGTLCGVLLLAGVVLLPFALASRAAYIESKYKYPAFEAGRHWQEASLSVASDDHYGTIRFKIKRALIEESKLKDWLAAKPARLKYLKLPADGEAMHLRNKILDHFSENNLDFPTIRDASTVQGNALVSPLKAYKNELAFRRVVADIPYDPVAGYIIPMM